MIDQQFKPLLGLTCVILNLVLFFFFVFFVVASSQTKGESLGHRMTAVKEKTMLPDLKKYDFRYSEFMHI